MTPSQGSSHSPLLGRDISDVVRQGLFKDSSIASAPPSLDRSDTDQLEQRIDHAVKECTPKPVVGPAVSSKVGTLMKLYVNKPEFLKCMKISEKYPRPKNVPSLQTPDVPHDVDKTMDQKVIKDDKRLRNDQICTAASIASLGGVLDIFF